MKESGAQGQRGIYYCIRRNKYNQGIIHHTKGSQIERSTDDGNGAAESEVRSSDVNYMSLSAHKACGEEVFAFLRD